VSALVPPIIERQLEAGRKASNLAFALRILPPDRRHDALVFYRFCRTLDDIADSPDLSAEERENALDAWAAALQTPGGAPPDLEGIIARHQIDRRLLQELLAGVRADLTVHRYATFEEARQYCWRVASAVGLASIRIFGCKNAASETYAEALGLALQWTNILRDVGEDARRDRIYLPTEDLNRFGVSGNDLLAGNHSRNFAALMKFESERAREYFEKARRALPDEDRRALLPAEIMREIYSRVLSRMQRDNFRVFEKRYRLGRLEKTAIITRAFLSSAWSPRAAG
jgi:phytoene synthase